MSSTDHVIGTMSKDENNGHSSPHMITFQSTSSTPLAIHDPLWIEYWLVTQIKVNLRDPIPSL